MTEKLHKLLSEEKENIKNWQALDQAIPILEILVVQEGMSFEEIKEAIKTYLEEPWK